MTKDEEKELTRLAEQGKALGRLTATDVASLLDSDISSTLKMDQIRATLRIMSLFKLDPVMAETVQQKMIKQLQDADLTINFRGTEFFEKLTGLEFINTFGRSDNGPGYMRPRDETEEKLFDYSNSKLRSGKPAVQGVVDRIKTFGSYINGTNPTFKHESRPKYGALNFSNAVNGPAKAYGRSFLILKEYIKHNATFTDADSFNYQHDADAASKLANYHNLHRLIINMGDRKLRAVYNSTTGSKLANAAVDASSYIEAQLHANIMLNRDIAKMCVSRTEVRGGVLQKQYEAFTKKFGIQLVYIE